MANFLYKYIRLSYKQKILAIITIIILAYVRILIKSTAFGILSQKFLHPINLNQTPRISINNHRKYAILIGRMISKIAQYTPWESKCLVQALTCRILLRWYKIPSIVYIGVNKNELNGLISHAWVNYNEITILGGNNSFNDFKIISQFADTL